MSPDPDQVYRFQPNVGTSSGVHMSTQINGPPSEYKYIGKCEHSCEHCGARFWYKERIKDTRKRIHLAYHRSYMAGRVVLRSYQIYPEYIQLLLKDRHFMENIRAYNQMFNMTSLVEGERPRFLQLYVYDTDNEMDNRMFHFSGTNSDLRRDIVDDLIELLDNHNALVQLFRTAREKLLDSEVPPFKVRLFNVVGQPQRVNKLHPSYMALQFPLLFVYGKDGYSKDMKMVRVSGVPSDEDRWLTMKAYYSIDFIRAHQNDIRNEYLSGIYDAIRCRDSDGSDCGGRLILPQSFTGGPRYMYAHYLDALAICRIHGNPSYFITFTCNVKWPEITEYLHDFREVTTADRANIVDRVFEMKIHQFVKYLRDTKPFGKVIAIVYTVEFQKCGLPYCHTLSWIDENSHIHNYEDIDNYISAELPSKETDPEGHMVVAEFMIHGPCGAVCPTAACMKNGPMCTKLFPKEYCKNTYIDAAGFVHYRRRDTRITTLRKNMELDNGYVVPYNRQLLHTFYARINVEHYGCTMLIKYLFKYISKCTDRIAARLTRTDVPNDADIPSLNEQPRIVTDEIKNYLDSRYIGPHEACWRLFKFDIHYRDPAVQVLAVHAENMQRVVFREKDQLESMANNLHKKKTTLTEWLDYNSHHADGRQLTYLDFPSKYVWDKSHRGLNVGSYKQTTYGGKSYYRDLMAIERDKLIHKLNDCQRNIFNLIIHVVATKTQELIFVYGHGGTGKTFLWKTIIYTLRGEGKIVLAVAYSGIASLLLPSGRTAHSRFKLPLDLSDSSVCLVTNNTQLARLLKETDLIIWDESPMNDRRCFETLDRTLRDILDTPNKLFGGKPIMLGGDFRQTLLVKKSASRTEIIGSSIAESYLWHSFRLFLLTKNMRLTRGTLTEVEKTEVSTFAQWLLNVGDGIVGVPDESDPENTSWLEIPEKFLIPNDENGLTKLIEFIYDKDSLLHPNAKDLQDKAIVCPKNDIADVINAKVMDMLPGYATTYISNDEAIPHGHNESKVELLYPVEYLNTLNFSGIPPHELNLKIGSLIMLLRNINIVGGLCNRTRMIVTQLLPKIIKVQIITGTRIYQKAYIPRIPLTMKDCKLPFVFKRKQFPVRLCYAMTINKSQGQSLKKIGIYLPEPFFGHGQLTMELANVDDTTQQNKGKIILTDLKITYISKLSSTTYDKTIEAIVYRKWISKTTRTRTPTKFCCILIDRQGTPIQANMGLLDANYFDQLLQLQKAYQFTSFSCEPTDKWERTLPTKTSLIFGRFLQVQEIPCVEFPEHYFNFAAYNELQDRLTAKNPILTGIQLSATSATHYYLNPNIPETNQLKQLYPQLPDKGPTLVVMNERYEDIDREKM
nr:DNA helicase [Tanacetum cinerariifolium]